MITVFVLLMMIVIEYVNVQSKNMWTDRIRHSPLRQIMLAAVLGIIPGCMGAFTVVSLYTHRIVRMSALVTAMIATSGDEAFVMFGLFPGKALLLNLILLLIAISAGLIVHLLSKDKKHAQPHGFVLHEKEYCSCFVKENIIPQLKAMSFERALLMFLTVFFIVLLMTGIVIPGDWNWKHYTYTGGALFLLFVFATVPGHFLKEHLYEHIIKKHLLRLFLWTWGAFIALHFIQTNNLLNSMLENNAYIILLIAAVVGLIPESGPHLIFVSLFSQNIIPFSVLLTSSIVQDGHGMLPLLAESRKDFIKVKIINMAAGIIAGLLLMLMGV